MAEYQSHNTGEEIDAAIDRIKNGEIDDIASNAAASATAAARSAINAAKSAASALDSKSNATVQAEVSKSNADRADLAASRSPYISSNKTWMRWDSITGNYVDTEIIAEGTQGPKGDAGETGATGDTGPMGPKGDKGDKGDTGKGLDIRGYYNTTEELFAADPDHDYMYGVGTVAPFDIWDWDSINSLWVNNGKLQGADGKSAYQVAVDGGFVGTQDEWLLSLKGEKGDAGAKGEQGVQGEQGIQGFPGPKAVSFTLTLAEDGWIDNAQTVSDEKILVDGFSYIVSPDDQSFLAYSSSLVRANDIEQDGQITFLAGEAPSASLLVNIVRIEVI